MVDEQVLHHLPDVRTQEISTGGICPSPNYGFIFYVLTFVC